MFGEGDHEESQWSEERKGCPFIVILGHSYDFRHILYMTVTEVKSTFGYNDKTHFMQFKNKRELLDPLYGRQGKRSWLQEVLNPEPQVLNSPVLIWLLPVFLSVLFVSECHLLIS